MDELIEILSELHSEIDYTAHTALIDDCVLDSFNIVSIIAEAADRFGAVIPAEEIVPENFNSAAALYDLIVRLLDE